VGLTTLKVGVANVASPDRIRTLDFLVDSGAIYSVVPAGILNELGIDPIATQEFRLADGSLISRRKGGAIFRLGDRVGAADVIFGEEGDHRLLGAFTLEALGLGLDPLRRELLPLPMMLA
jgi:predicted aspartyl protease